MQLLLIYLSSIESYLVHNPLICDCRMAWLPAFLVEKEAGGTQWARCAEPLEVQGRHVRDLLPILMQCDGEHWVSKFMGCFISSSFGCRELMRKR